MTESEGETSKFGQNMVGMTGFEPAASWSQTKHSTKLSYIPIMMYLLGDSFFIIA